MKQYLVILLSLALIVNSNCGFLDSVLGTVSNTAHSITHGVGDVVHRGKNFVFGGTEQNAAGQVVIKPGIVGTISHKIHDVSSNVREEFRALIHFFDGDKLHRKGIIGRLFDRVKCRVFKIKSFLSGNGYNEPAQTGHTQIGNRPHVPFQPLKNDTRVLSEKLRKYFFSKNSPATSGIRQTLNSLHEVIDKIRFNVTRKRQESGNENSEFDGTGLIDIRASANNLGGLGNDFNHGVDAAYDKVDEIIDEGRQSAQSSFNRAQHNTNEFLENQRRNVQNYYNQFGDNVDRFRSDVVQSINNNIENQRRNVQHQYNQMASNADRFRSEVGQSVTDNLEYQRRNIQNNYNQLGENANRFRTHISQSVNDNLENQRRNVQNHYNDMANNADTLRSEVDQSVTDNIDYQRRSVQNHYNQYANNADRTTNNLGQSIGNTIDNQRRNLQSHYNQFNNNADRFKTDLSQSVTDNLENQRTNVQNNYNVMVNNADKLRSDIDSSINDLGVRVGDETSRATNLMQNGYRKLDVESKKLGEGY